MPQRCWRRTRVAIVRVRRAYPVARRWRSRARVRAGSSQASSLADVARNAVRAVFEKKAKVGAGHGGARFACASIELGGGCGVWCSDRSNLDEARHVAAAKRDAAGTGLAKECKGALVVLRNALAILGHDSQVIAGGGISALAGLGEHLCGARNIACASSAIAKGGGELAAGGRDTALAGLREKRCGAHRVGDCARERETCGASAALACTRQKSICACRIGGNAIALTVATSKLNARIGHAGRARAIHQPKAARHVLTNAHNNHARFPHRRSCQT